MDDDIIILSNIPSKNKVVCDITRNQPIGQKVSLLCPYSRHRLIDPVIPDCCTEKHPFKAVCRQCIETFKSSNKNLRCPFCNVGIFNNKMVEQTQISQALLKTNDDVEFLWNVDVFGLAHLFLDETRKQAVVIEKDKYFYPIPKQVLPTEITKEKHQKSNTATYPVFQMPSFKNTEQKKSLSERMKKTKLPRCPKLYDIIQSHTYTIQKMLERTKKNIKIMEMHERDTTTIKKVLYFLESSLKEYHKAFD